MGKWSKSLPEPMENHTDRAANALYLIGMSMMDEFPVRNRVANARRAAAEVRAWRKSLGVKSERARLIHRVSKVRGGLRAAALAVLVAEDANTDGWRAVQLRHAEMYLREAARLLDKEQA